MKYRVYLTRYLTRQVQIVVEAKDEVDAAEKIDYGDEQMTVEAAFKNALLEYCDDEIAKVEEELDE